MQTNRNKAELLNKYKIIPKGFRSWNEKLVEQREEFAKKQFLSNKNRNKITKMFTNNNEEFEINEEDIYEFLEEKNFDKIMFLLNCKNKDIRELTERYLEKQMSNKAEETDASIKSDSNDNNNLVNDLRNTVRNLEIKNRNIQNNFKKLSEKLIIKDKDTKKMKEKYSKIEKDIKEKNKEIYDMKHTLIKKEKEIVSLKNFVSELNIENSKLKEILDKKNEKELLEKQKEYLLLGKPSNIDLSKYNKIKIFDKNYIDDLDIYYLKNNKLKLIAYCPALTVKEKSLLCDFDNITYIYDYKSLKGFLKEN